MAPHLRQRPQRTEKQLSNMSAPEHASRSANIATGAPVASSTSRTEFDPPRASATSTTAPDTNRCHHRYKFGTRYRCWECGHNRNTMTELKRHFSPSCNAHPGITWDPSKVVEYYVEDSNTSARKVAKTSHNHILPTTNSRLQQGLSAKSEDTTSPPDDQSAFTFTPVKTRKDFEEPVILPHLLSVETQKLSMTSTTLPKTGTQAVEPGSKGSRLRVPSQSVEKRLGDQSSEEQGTAAVTEQDVAEPSAKRVKFAETGEQPNFDRQLSPPANLQFTTPSTSFAVASSEDRPMQELHPIEGESQRPTRSRLVMPFPESAVAVQQVSKRRKKSVPDLVHNRNLFMARINKDIIEEASGKFGRNEVNGPAFHAGIIMLDEMYMHIKEQDDMVRCVKKKNKALQRDLASSKDHTEGLTSSLALKELEVTELEETETALIEVLDRVEDIAVEECEARDLLTAKLKFMNEASAMEVEKLTETSKGQGEQIEELEKSACHQEGRIAQLGTAVNTLSTCAIVLKDWAQDKDVRITELEALARVQAQRIEALERGSQLDSLDGNGDKLVNVENRLTRTRAEG